MPTIEVTGTKTLYYSRVVEVTEEELKDLEEYRTFPTDYLEDDSHGIETREEWEESDYGVLEDDLPSGFEYQV